MLMRKTMAGSLLRYDHKIELRVHAASLRSFYDFLTILPTSEELETCRTLLLNFSALDVVYPLTAAVLAAWFLHNEHTFDEKNIEVDYDPPNDDNPERWLDEVGFTHRILNVDGAVGDRRRTMVLHEIAAGASDASYTVADDVDALIRRNGLPIVKESLGSLFVALSEVVENITRHAHIVTPAFACAQVHPGMGKFSVCIADMGIGLAESFRNAPYAPARERIESRDSPLDLAIEPLMSSKYGMGNSGYGLFYASELCAMSKGTFTLTSGSESLIIYPNGRYRKTHGFWNGTIINMLLDTNSVIDGSKVWEKLPDLNEDEPRVAYIETQVHGCFHLRQFGKRLLTRDVGVRALDMAFQQTDVGLIVSLDGVEVMTPSFADEFFGGLFTRLGAARCREHVSVARADYYSQNLIEMVLKHRAERK